MNNQEKLNNLRHSTAHLLAAAVLDLYPGTKLTIGPTIESGFYYDFEFVNSISEEDFPKIEQKMTEILKIWDGFSKREVSEKEAKEFYKDNPYKRELVDEIVQKNEPITFYKVGDFEDLCRGGHAEDPKNDIGAFKLLSLAGAYWRGSEKNTMLTRIYGTAFPTQKELDDHLLMLEEAKKRDHKKLGKELDLFIFSPLVGGGLALWTPKGTILRQELDNFIWSIRRKYGYERVTIPHITKKDLYEVSGHWEKFSDELFKIETREGDLFAMKPMNCPHHTQLYAYKPRSYKELPIRFSETTMCYRDEQSGELSGLSRLRAFTQDDAHVFLRKSHIQDEFLRTWDIVDEFYSAFGFDLKVRLSLHDPEQMEKYLGDSEVWKNAEDQLRAVVTKRKVEAYEGIGEAAMYGPKLDFITRDALGREWQVATIQLDLNQPKRFGLVCINEEGKEEDIVMMHCAVMGSIERFTSILIEHYAGAFPLWLSPVQVQLLPIADRHTDFAEKTAEEMRKHGIRVEVNHKAETLQGKIRDAALQKVPYLGIIGDKEIEAEAVSVRVRGGTDEGQTKISEFLQRIEKEIDKKA
jgi:threonyl-tRNA synthetase